MRPLKTQKEVMELFEKWWNNEGSGMPPKPGEDAEIHVKRISAIAWSNGACCVGGGGMSELEQIEAGIKSAVNQIKDYQVVVDELRKALSKQFIEKHKPTLDEVEMSSGEGKPYFGHVWAFTHWMKENNTSKRFCEWSQVVYLTSEMLQGRMSQTEFTTIDDIEGFQNHE